VIWALAGPGADYSTYNAGYTPAQRDAPVRPTTLVERTGTPTFKIPENAYVPPVEVPQQTETPWALVGLVVLGLGVAYASYKSDEARGYEPNRKGKRSSKKRRRGGYYNKKGYRMGVTDDTMVYLHLHQSGENPGSYRKAIANLKSFGIKPGKLRKSKLDDGRPTWGMKVRVKMGKANAFQRKFNNWTRQGYESYID